MGDLICVDDFEKYAYKNLPRNALDYYRSGAGQQRTLSDNKIAFSKWVIFVKKSLNLNINNVYLFLSYYSLN